MTEVIEEVTTSEQNVVTPKTEEEIKTRANWMLEKYRPIIVIALFIIVMFGIGYFIFNIETIKANPVEYCRNLGCYCLSK